MLIFVDDVLGIDMSKVTVKTTDCTSLYGVLLPLLLLPLNPRDIMWYSCDMSTQVA